MVATSKRPGKIRISQAPSFRSTSTVLNLCAKDKRPWIRFISTNFNTLKVPLRSNTCATCSGNGELERYGQTVARPDSEECIVCRCGRAANALKTPTYIARKHTIRLQRKYHVYSLNFIQFMVSEEIRQIVKSRAYNHTHLQTISNHWN